MRIVTNIKSQAKKIAYFITRSPAAAKSVLEDTADRIQTRMNVRREKEDYPVTWDSEKQRRAYFATDGFGAGIPYERTGKTVWTVDKSFASEVDLFAPHPAGALFGMPDADPPFWQSRIHRKTWPFLRDVMTDEISKIPKEILKSLKILLNDVEGMK